LLGKCRPMGRVLTKYFGALEYSPDAVFEFNSGIPGFEGQIEFVFLEQPRTAPLVFMQSLADETLCFVAVSVLVADPAYRLSISTEDREALRLPAEEEVEIGRNLLCFALVTVNPGADPTCNLASPIVVNPKSRLGLQAFQECSEALLRSPLFAPEEFGQC
jgi:flagellar assembly factor FliW